MNGTTDVYVRYSRYFLVALAAAWCVFRFVGLENAPYGIWMDESRVALHTACLVETGRPAGSQLWPFFAPAFGDGHHPSTLLFFDVIFTQVFGNSIAVFRAVSAIAILATIAGLISIVRRISSPGLTLFVFVSAAVSPWSFQFSRVAWEGPLAPAFLVWGVYFLLVPPRWFTLAGAGALGALAMFTYPPLRIASPLVLLTVGLVQIRMGKLRWRDALPAIAALFIVLSPVIVLTLQGKLSGRAMSVAIFSNEYLDGQRGNLPRLQFFIGRFLDNLWLHFRPSYLFVTGDENLRHSAQIVGQLSPVDALGAMALLSLFAWNRFRRKASAIDAENEVQQNGLARCYLKLVALGIAGFTFGSIPAALTWDTVPHSLRSIGAWPWACLASGAALAWVVQLRPRFILLVAGVAAVYSVLYLPRYFDVYKHAPVDTFRRDLWEAIQNRGNTTAAVAVRPLLDRYGDDELRYYLIRWDHMGCRSSEKALHRLRQP
jgi:hypothetical protein